MKISHKLLITFKKHPESIHQLLQFQRKTSFLLARHVHCPLAGRAVPLYVVSTLLGGHAHATGQAMCLLVASTLLGGKAHAVGQTTCILVACTHANQYSLSLSLSLSHPEVSSELAAACCICLCCNYPSKCHN